MDVAVRNHHRVARNAEGVSAYVLDRLDAGGEPATRIARPLREPDACLPPPFAMWARGP